MVDYPTTSMIYVGCNTRSGSCQSKSFRQVLNYAFDRETLATKNALWSCGGCCVASLAEL